DRLIKLQEEIAAERSRSLVGKEFKVLCESYADGSSNALLGRTEGNVIIEFAGKKESVGSFQKVKVLSTKTWRLFGELA
ncbi:MAG TPA: TRAM domain-containing protein, partial [Oscillospiraceae bacterium]|nr:TRAM domain-containing protein [Oscillospiraceae bacterium]